MLFLWFGILAGFSIGYLVIRAGEHRRSKRPLGGWRMAARGMAWLLLVYVVLLAMTSGWDGLDDYGRSDTTRIARYLASVLVPLMTGIVVGVGLLGLARSLVPFGPGRPTADHAPPEPSSTPDRLSTVAAREPEASFRPDPPSTATIAFVALGALVTVFLVKDPQLSWLEGLQKASIGGVELTFADRGGLGGIGVELGAQSGAYPGRAGAPSPSLSNIVATALDRLSQIDAMIDRDIAYLKENPLAEQAGDATAEISAAARKFMRDVLAPTAGLYYERNITTHYSDVFSDRDRQMIDRLRRFIKLRPDERRFEDYLDRYDRIVRTIVTSWSSVCRELPSKPQAPAAVAGVTTAVPKSEYDLCNDERVAVATAAAEVRESIAERKLAVFDGRHAYGAIIASLMLQMAQQTEAALADLDEWISPIFLDFEAKAKSFEASGEPTAFQIYQLQRALFFQQELLILLPPTAETIHSLRATTKRRVAVVKYILNGKEWQAVLDKVEKYQRPGFSHDGQACARYSSENFKIFLYSALSAVNNFSYYSALQPDSFASERREIYNLTEYLKDFDRRCLKSTANSDDTLLAWAGTVLDTHAAVHLAGARDAGFGDAASRGKEACIARESAREAVRLATAARGAGRTQAPPLSLRTRDAVESEAIERLNSADRRLREAEALVRQLNPGGTCK